jgi:hypothetical protein
LVWIMPDHLSLSLFFFFSTLYTNPLICTLTPFIDFTSLANSCCLSCCHLDLSSHLGPVFKHLD